MSCWSPATTSLSLPSATWPQTGWSLVFFGGLVVWLFWQVFYISFDRLLLLDQRQRGQLYTALKNGFTSILGFLQELSMTLREQPHHLESHQKKYFVCATIRILGAWLSEETMAMREEVYEILPFILDISNDTFESQKLTKLSLLPGRGSTDFSDFTAPDSCAMMQRQPGKQVKIGLFSITSLPPVLGPGHSRHIALSAACALPSHCRSIKYLKIFVIPSHRRGKVAADSPRHEDPGDPLHLPLLPLDHL